MEICTHPGGDMIPLGNGGPVSAATATGTGTRTGIGMVAVLSGCHKRATRAVWRQEGAKVAGVPAAGILYEPMCSKWHHHPPWCDLLLLPLSACVWRGCEQHRCLSTPLLPSEPPDGMEPIPPPRGYVLQEERQCLKPPKLGMGKFSSSPALAWGTSVALR